MAQHLVNLLHAYQHSSCPFSSLPYICPNVFVWLTSVLLGSPLPLLHDVFPPAPSPPCSCHQQDSLLTQQGNSTLSSSGLWLLSSPSFSPSFLPSLFLLLSHSLLCDLNAFWISLQEREWVQLSGGERDSLPSITQTRVSQWDQRCNGKAGSKRITSAAGI